MAKMPFREERVVARKQEIHGRSIDGPYVNGDQFVVRFTMDVTPKVTGKRMKMDEVGVYAVKNGKIVSERFYYLPA